MQLDSSPDTAIADDYKALTTAQNEIIDRIANLEGAIGTSEDKNLLASLRDHKAAYNELADQLLNRQRQIPRFDPLEKLPPELWIRIIFMLLAPYWLPDSAAASYSIDVDLAFSLTLVPKPWQHVILGFPQFWTYISVDPTCPDSMVKAFTCLELSANLPVSLCLSRLSNIEWDMIGPHIIRNKHRIHRFWMIGGERSDETIYLGRQEFLMILLPLPNLRWVGSLFGIDHELEKKILGACPLLEGMVLRNITESFPDDINLDRFTHVKLPVSEIPLLLERSPPSLEDVEVVYSAGPGDHLGPLLDAPLLNGGDLGWRFLTWFDVHHSLPMKLLC
ncbi:hypothetical protein CPB86DRAFT_869024 [Serendipita vermifera]|nr:hypothetical protein CPB86DRAFT_869024 [Serendipita vermifera]